MSYQHILIVGATSAVAEAAAQELAGANVNFHLIARSEAKLKEVAHDLEARGSAVSIWSGDIRDEETMCAHLKVILDQSPIDFALFCNGVLGDTAKAESDSSMAREIFDTNFSATAIALSYIAQSLAEKKTPATIAVLSSVAGDRGRQSNYFYGAAKGAMSLFLAGMRNRYFKQGIHVLTVKPGFIATPMTAHLNHNALFVTPQFVARQTIAAAKKKRNIIYTPGIWRWIMLVIRSIPEVIFKRLSL